MKTLEEFKSLKLDVATMLVADDWTAEKLATATVKELVAYKGVGRIGAAKIIAEAAEILNAQGLAVAEDLAADHYYQKRAPETILRDWEADGLTPNVVALSSARALAALKGIGEPLSMRLISAAQDIVNRRGLHQSDTVIYGPTRQINPAFDEKWLSGEVAPPPMSIRIRRNFEKAQKDYKEAL